MRFVSHAAIAGDTHDMASFAISSNICSIGMGVTYCTSGLIYLQPPQYL